MGTYRRWLAIAIISSGMLLLQVQPSLQAATSQTGAPTNAAPAAVVILTRLGHIGPVKAASGTTVYSGDNLNTDPGGELRLVVAGGQVFLLSDSAAKIGNSGTALQATLLRGTVGFSSLTDRQFQILTPEGLIEAAYGQPAYGQVSFTGPHNDIVVSAFTGALVLHRGDQTLVVKAGQSYYVSLVPDPAPPQGKGPVLPYKYHLEWRIIVVGVAGGVGYFLWQELVESPTSPAY